MDILREHRRQSRRAQMNNAYTPNNAYIPVGSPPRMVRSSGHQSAAKIILAVFALMVAALLGLIVLLLIGSETGPIELIIGMICATLPVPIYVMLLLWIDRYESEPLWMLTTTFLWGALVAVFIAIILNTVNGAIITAVTNSAQIGEHFGAVISAPIVEESAKAFILLVLFFWKRDEFDGIVDGIVYAGMVGLGFAMTENILYYGRAALGGGGSLTLIFIIRGFFAPFSHPLFTSLTGMGLGLARQSTNTAVKILTPIVGLLMAIFMHSIWNGSAVLGGGGLFVLTYLLVMVPAFIIMLVVIGLALRREGQVVREYLTVDLNRGFLTQEEYKQLGSIFGRMGSSFNAFTQTGVSGWRARMRFNQLASELAFHRCRVSRGVYSGSYDVLEMETAYLHALQGLLNELRNR